MGTKERILNELRETGERNEAFGGTNIQGGLDNPIFEDTITKTYPIGSYDNLEDIQDSLDYNGWYGSDSYDAIYCFKYESAQDVYDIFDYFSPIFDGTMKTKDFNAILQDFAQQTGMSLDIVLTDDLNNFVADFLDAEGREVSIAFDVVF